MEQHKDITGILFLIIFITILGTFQIISHVVDNDLLAPFPMLNFFIMPVCFGISLVIFYLLYRSSYFVKIMGLINRVKKWLKLYPFIYKTLRFVFRHPLFSGLLLGIIGALIDFILFN